MPASPILPRHPFLQLVRDFAIRWFPKNNSRPTPSSMRSAYSPRQSPSIVPAILTSFTSIGPFLSRLVVQGSLSDVHHHPPARLHRGRWQHWDVGYQGAPRGGPECEFNMGLSQRLPTGLAAPADSPNEVYPFSWEIPLDEVYLDGQNLP